MTINDLDIRINRAFNRRTVHIALLDAPGQDTRAVCAFTDINDANAWVDNEGAEEMRYTQTVDLHPPSTSPQLPEPLRDLAEFGMLAADIAKAISDYGYADKGFDVGDDAIEAVLADFIVGALEAQVRLDAQRQD